MTKKFLNCQRTRRLTCHFCQEVIEGFGYFHRIGDGLVHKKIKALISNGIGDKLAIFLESYKRFWVFRWTSPLKIKVFIFDGFYDGIKNIKKLYRHWWCINFIYGIADENSVSDVKINQNPTTHPLFYFFFF